MIPHINKDKHYLDYWPQGEYTTVITVENKERPKCQKLSWDAGPDMNADGKPACEVSENKDAEYINEVNESTEVMGVRKGITHCQCFKG